MKKLFEKPLFHYTFVLTVVSIVCGIMIGAVNAITAPIIENNIKEAQAAAYSRVLSGLDDFEEVALTSEDPSTVVGKVIGYNAADEIIGYIYTGYTTNKYGYMRIVVSVNASGIILGADFIEINQTYQVDGTRTNLSLYVGSPIANLAPQGDIVTGATGSLNSVQQLLSDIAVSHSLTATEPPLPYAEYYGNDYVLVEDTTFSGTLVTNKYTVEGQGTVYLVTGSGEYFDGNEGSITLHVLLDNDGEIIKLLLPEEDYGHTKRAPWGTNNLTYLSYFEGLTLSQVEQVVDDNDDLQTGATNTKTLIEILLRALVSEVTA